MLIAPPHPQEKLRQLELDSLLILDSEPEAMFDRLVEVARSLAGCSIGLISLVDSNRQWFKSRCGLDAEQTPRDVAFCSHTILMRQPLIIENALLDERFADNPLVVDGPCIRFYAGFPLITGSQLAVGTLCLIDKEPRTLNGEQIQQLQALADQVVELFELRRRSLALEVSQFTSQGLELIVNAAGMVVLARGNLSESVRASRDWEGQPLLEQVPLEPKHVEKLVNRDPEKALALTVDLKFPGASEPEAQSYRLDVLPIGQLNPLLQGLSLVRVRRPNSEEIGFEQQNQFLQILSHEVNTPLAIVQGNLHRLQKRQPNEPLVTGAVQEARRMTRLFERLMLLARLDELLHSKEMERLNASGLVQRWWRDASAEIQTRVRLSCCGTRTSLDLYVRLAPQLFFILLSELVDNALRFSEANSPVDVVLAGSLDGQTMHVFVVDQGPGLDPMVLKAGFEAFRKSEVGRRAERPEGSGLGLHLVDTLVSRLEGTLHIHRITEGTAIQIQLPLSAQPSRQQTVGVSQETARADLASCSPALEKQLSQLLG